MVLDSPAPGIKWDGFVTPTKPKRPMASDNRISWDITAAQKTAIVDAVVALKTALQGITRANGPAHPSLGHRPRNSVCRIMQP